MMGRADRHFGPVINGKLTEIDKFGTRGIPPIYADIRRMAEFIESRGIRFWRMRPGDSLLEAGGDLIYCLAAEDEEYLVYFVNGGAASLRVPGGEAEWFNPRSGETREKTAVPEGRISFTAPDAEDWVLYIKVPQF
jgi:hypothetical protein